MVVLLHFLALRLTIVSLDVLWLVITWALEIYMPTPLALGLGHIYQANPSCPCYNYYLNTAAAAVQCSDVIVVFVQLRVEREQYLIAVEQHAQQFRAIQKRLLNRFKDNTPSSLQHLDTLLDGTFLQVSCCVVCRIVCNKGGECL